MKRSMRAAASAIIVLGTIFGIPVRSHADSSIPGMSVMQQSSTGIFLRADGDFMTEDLPSVALGLRNSNPPPPFTNTDTGVVTSFHNPRSSGYGTNAGFGYILPPGFVPPILGTDARVEVDGHYAHTDASQSQTTAVGTFGVYPELLGGTVANNGWLCGTSTFSCPTTSALTAQFTAWQLTAKAESDFHLGTITVTPSVALIGGEGDNNEGLRQNLTQLDSGAPNGNFQDYSATVKLHWRDIGGKVGLNGGVPVTPWLSLSLGGSVGLVDRDAHLSGNDFFNSNVPLTAPQTNPLTSSVSGSDNTAAFMSTFEASVNVTPLPGLLFRGFAGLNVDSGIPGVTTPSYTGSEALSPATIISVPAKVKFSSETALYIGGGAVVRF